ncbi:MAG: redoxin domain-containing protein [Salinivirgaceae bacterium]|nr:redoxin domain-containing protein [Salinivirgaceae bacterium]
MSYKKIKSILFLVLFTISSYCIAQPIKNVKLLNIKEDTITFTISKDYVLLSFFAADCGSCIKELKALDIAKDKWLEKFNIQIIGVANKNAVKSTKKLQKFTTRFNYEIPLFIDVENSLTNYFKDKYKTNERCFFEYKGSNYASTPQIFILDKNGDIVFHKKGYKDGDIQIIESILTELILQ